MNRLNPAVSVLIVNWNTRDLTDAAIASFYRFEDPSAFEIILVDNASNDGSAEFLAGKYPGIKVIANRRNAGFAVANNQGASEALGEYLLLFNSDAFLTERVLSACLEAMSRRGPCVLGCRILNRDRSPQLSTDRFPTLGHYFLESLSSSQRSERAAMARQAALRDYVNPVDWLTGAFFMVDRRTYLELGGLNRDIFMYGEDMEFCRRAGEAGVPCLYFPSVSIVHLGGGSIDYSTLQSLTRTDQGRIKTFGLMGGRSKAGALRAIFMFRSAVRVAFNLAGACLPSGRAARNRLSNHFREILILGGLRAGGH